MAKNSIEEYECIYCKKKFKTAEPHTIIHMKKTKLYMHENCIYSFVDEVENFMWYLRPHNKEEEGDLK